MDEKHPSLSYNTSGHSRLKKSGVQPYLCRSLCSTQHQNKSTKTQLGRGLTVFGSHYKLLSCVCVFMAEKTQTNPAKVPRRIKLWLILPVMWKQRVYKMASSDWGWSNFAPPGSARCQQCISSTRWTFSCGFFFSLVSHSPFDLDVMETGIFLRNFITPRVTR